MVVELVHIPGCERCRDGREALRRAAEAAVGDELVWRDLDVMEHMDYAVSLGVLSLPAMAIEGRLVFSSLPTPAQLRRALLDDHQMGGSDGR